MQTERRRLTLELRALRERRSLAAAIEQGGDEASDEGVEQVVRLQPIGLLSESPNPAACPLCQQALDDPIPSVDQLAASLSDLERQIAAVERDRPGLVDVQDELLVAESEMKSQLEANSQALERLADSADAVNAHQQRLDLGAWVRGRIDHYLEKALVATDERLTAYRGAEAQLAAKIAALEEELDPGRVRDAAASVLIGIGRRMTDMARFLGLEHAESFVRIDLGRLTVIADTPTGPVYMNTNIGSAKNWVGYHLAAVLGLQEHFVRQGRPVPRFLVLDQPTQAFFPADRTSDEVSDQDRADALAQFELMRDVVDGLEGKLQILVLDHAEFDEDWFRAAIVERWRDGRALIPQHWLVAEETSEPPGAADSDAD